MYKTLNGLKIIFFAVALLLNFAVKAQVLLPTENSEGNHQLFLQIGFEPELITSIGYAHKISNRNNGIHVGASIKLAPLIIKNQAYKVNFFTSLNYKFSEKGFAMITPQIYYAHQKDRAGTIDGLGFEINFNPYWYGKKWTKGFELGWQNTTFGYIRHSREARATFDDRYTTINTQYPIDGWYNSTSNRFKIGFTGAKHLNKRLDLQISVGSLAILQKQKILLGFSHAQVPIYLNGMVRYKID